MRYNYCSRSHRRAVSVCVFRFRLFEWIIRITNAKPSHKMRAKNDFRLNKICNFSNQFLMLSSRRVSYVLYTYELFKARLHLIARPLFRYHRLFISFSNLFHEIHERNPHLHSAASFFFFLVFFFLHFSPLSLDNCFIHFINLWICKKLEMKLLLTNCVRGRKTNSFHIYIADCIHGYYLFYRIGWFYAKFTW